MNIGGKERPVKIGFNQSVLYCELRGVSISAMNEDYQKMAQGQGNGSEVRDLIWSALKDGARVAKEEFEYSNLDVGDWMEEIEPGQVTEFINELSANLPTRKDKTKSKKKV